ncbi:MAG: hypothetical protein L6Q99_06025 [Planctomycetes bacterium]|nr:hypothetical protein [Planctomycetota bacterium]
MSGDAAAKGFEALRRRLSELVAALEHGEVDAQALEGVLYSTRIEFERLQSNAFGLHVARPEERERREGAAREVQRLVAVALDLAARRKDDVARELERTRDARKRLGFYQDADTGDSCDVRG